MGRNFCRVDGVTLRTVELTVSEKLDLGEEGPFIVDDAGVEPLPDDVPGQGLPSESVDTKVARSRAEVQVLHLRHELTLFRLRLQILAERAKLTAAAQGHYVSSSAHQQLGDYPWAKLFAASCAAFIVGRLMRR